METFVLADPKDGDKMVLFLVGLIVVIVLGSVLKALGQVPDVPGVARLPGCVMVVLVPIALVILLLILRHVTSEFYAVELGSDVRLRYLKPRPRKSLARSEVRAVHVIRRDVSTPTTRGAHVFLLRIDTTGASFLSTPSDEKDAVLKAARRLSGALSVPIEWRTQAGPYATPEKVVEKAVTGC